MLRFKYKQLPIKTFGKDVKNPVITLTVSTPENLEKLDFLLDSGADSTAIPLETAEGLGIQKGKEIKVGGVSGNIKAWEGKLKFVIEYHAYPRIEHEIDCKIIDNNNIPPILGRNPFFDWYEIKFKQREDTIELKPIQAPQNK